MAFLKICCFVLLLVSAHVHGLRELFRFQDLPALGSSTYLLREWFQKYYDAGPPGLAVNHETAFGALDPPTTVRYSRWCYKTIGEVKYVGRVRRPEHTQIIMNRFTVENNTPEPITKTVTVGADWTETVSHTTSNSMNLEFSAGVTISGVFSSGLSFSRQTTATGSQSTSRRQHSGVTLDVKIPPRSKRTVNLRGTRKVEDAVYVASISVDGWFGANFGKRVRGHYFWFAHSSLIFPGKTRGNLRVVVSGQTITDIHATVDV